MTAQAQADCRGQPPGDCAAEPGPATSPPMPTLALSETQLADLELLLSGAFAPLAGFMTMADVAAVADSWQLADGTPFPIAGDPGRPGRRRPGAGRPLALADPEGTPLAVLQITERARARTASSGLVRLAGAGDRAARPRARAVPAADADPGPGQGAGAATARCWPGRAAGRCTAARSASSGTWPASSRPGCWCCPWWPARPRS